MAGARVMVTLDLVLTAAPLLLLLLAGEGEVEEVVGLVPGWSCRIHILPILFWRSSSVLSPV